MGNYLPFRLVRLPFQRESDVEDFNSTAMSYRFPPITKSGCFFANNFIMAGEKFENMDPETFLFGDNNDLNYLPSQPVPFPYNAPGDNEPSTAVRCFVFLRKESLKLVKEDVAGSDDSDYYRVEFVFDADTDCAVRIFLMATEEFNNGCVTYKSRTPGLVSEPFMFKKGSGQTFNSTKFIIKPDDFQPSELNFIPGASEIPLVIQITVEDPDFLGQSISTIAGIEKLSDGMYTIKFLKQKVMIDGFCVMVQELYGIENKVKEQEALASKEDDAEDADDGSECVICMFASRDTIMLPCRHLCLCSECADRMRTRQNRCPICRANFHALLQIKAMRKKRPHGEHASSSLEEVSLFEALNGDLQLKNNVDSETVPKRRSSSARRRSAKKKNKESIKESETAPPETSPQETSPPEELLHEAYLGSNKEADKVVDSSTSSSKKALSNLVAEVCEEEKPSEHIDMSLPGTPMGSDGSADSLSASMTAPVGSMVATRAQIATLSNVKVGETVRESETANERD